MFACTKVSSALTIGLLGALLGQTQPLRAQAQNPVTAIDILLEPDATMVKHARPPTSACSRFSPRASLWARRINRTSRACSGT